MLVDMVDKQTNQKQFNFEEKEDFCENVWRKNQVEIPTFIKRDDALEFTKCFPSMSNFA